jgi:hypothetical protein
MPLMSDQATSSRAANKGKPQPKPLATLVHPSQLTANEWWLRGDHPVAYFFGFPLAHQLPSSSTPAPTPPWPLLLRLYG